jgi:phage-related minor tail protein
MSLTFRRLEVLDELAAEVESAVGEVRESLANLQDPDLDSEERESEKESVFDRVGELARATTALVAKADGWKR